MKGQVWELVKLGSGHTGEGLRYAGLFSSIGL